MKFKLLFILSTFVLLAPVVQATNYGSEDSIRSREPIVIGAPAGETCGGSLRGAVRTMSRALRGVTKMAVDPKTGKAVEVRMGWADVRSVLRDGALTRAYTVSNEQDAEGRLNIGPGAADPTQLEFHVRWNGVIAPFRREEIERQQLIAQTTQAAIRLAPSVLRILEVNQQIMNRPERSQQIADAHREELFGLYEKMFPRFASEPSQADEDFNHVIHFLSDMDRMDLLLHMKANLNSLAYESEYRALTRQYGAMKIRELETAVRTAAIADLQAEDFFDEVPENFDEVVKILAASTRANDYVQKIDIYARSPSFHNGVILWNQLPGLSEED